MEVHGRCKEFTRNKIQDKIFQGIRQGVIQHLRWHSEKELQPDTTQVPGSILHPGNRTFRLVSTFMFNNQSHVSNVIDFSLTQFKNYFTSSVYVKWSLLNNFVKFDIVRQSLGRKGQVFLSYRNTSIPLVARTPISTSKLSVFRQGSKI